MWHALRTSNLIDSTTKIILEVPTVLCFLKLQLEFISKSSRIKYARSTVIHRKKKPFRFSRQHEHRVFVDENKTTHSRALPNGMKVRIFAFYARFRQILSGDDRQNFCAIRH